MTSEVTGLRETMLTGQECRHYRNLADYLARKPYEITADQSFAQWQENRGRREINLKKTKKRRLA